MNINVDLTQTTLAMADITEPIVLPEDELILNFSSNIYNVKSLIVTVKNSEKKQQYKLKNCEPLDISAFLFGGILQIEISAILKGHVIKTWRIPDIFIKEVEHKFGLIPEIAEINRKFDELYKALKEIKNIIKGE